MTRILGAVWDWVCDVWCNLVTFGRWGRLSEWAEEVTLQLAEARRTRKTLETVEYRLDELMRHLEMELRVTIPGHIDAPRLTTWGVGKSIIEEATLLQDDIDRIKKEGDGGLAQSGEAPIPGPSDGGPAPQRAEGSGP